MSVIHYRIRFAHPLRWLAAGFENRRFKTTRRRNWCPCRPQGNSYKTVLFVTEKQPTSIALGWSEPVRGRAGVQVPMSSNFTAHFFGN
jgi:hypothetical protein